jgi:hypothetical protein
MKRMKYRLRNFSHQRKTCNKRIITLKSDMIPASRLITNLDISNDDEEYNKGRGLLLDQGFMEIL